MDELHMQKNVTDGEFGLNNMKGGNKGKISVM